MGLRAEIFLAWKYFKPKRNAVSIITLISIIGVGLGVGVMIVVLAVMTGFTDKMKEKLLDTTSHGRIYASGGVIRKPLPIVRQVKECGGDALPVLCAPALLQRDDNFVPKQLIAFDPAKDPGRVRLKDMVSRGEYSLKKGQAMISEPIALELGVDVGDKILLHSPSRLAKLVKKGDDGKIKISENAEVYLPDEFTVSGIFSFGKYDFDRNVIFAGIEDAVDLYGLPWNSANGIFIWTDDPFKMDAFTDKLKGSLAPGFFVRTWKEQNARLLDVLTVEKNMQFFLLAFIVLVAAFSITNTLITTVIQKTREIGLLKAMGADSGSVMRIFIMQGFLVGFIGDCLGIILGFLVVEYRMGILHTLRALTGMEIFPKEIYMFSSLPADIVASDVMWIAAISLVLCTFGGIVPAFRAASLDPASSLRYE